MFSLSLSKRGLAILFLLIAVLGSALAVIYVTTLNRQLFNALQQQQQVHEELQVEWSQLLLEQSTWAQQARVQEIAEHTLQMLVPPSNSVIIVKE